MPRKKKPQRVIVVLTLPADAGITTLEEVQTWLETEVNDDAGLGPANVTVYADVVQLVEDLDDGDETIHCTLDES